MINKYIKITTAKLKSLTLNTQLQDHKETSNIVSDVEDEYSKSVEQVKLFKSESHFVQKVLNYVL